MAQSYVKTHMGANAQAGITATVSVVSATAGNHLRLNVRASSDSRTIASVGGGAGNTWLDTGDKETDSTDSGQFMWYCENCVAGSYTVTVTFDSSAATNVEVFIDEFSGTATSNSLDTVDGNGAAIGASPISVTTGNSTTNANDNVYTVAMSTNGANARPFTTPPTTGYTADFSGPVSSQATQFCSAHKNITSTGNQSVTWAWTGGNTNATTIIAAFKDGAGGGGTTVIPAVTTLVGSSKSSIIGSSKSLIV